MNPINLWAIRHTPLYLPSFIINTKLAQPSCLSIFGDRVSTPVECGEYESSEL